LLLIASAHSIDTFLPSCFFTPFSFGAAAPRAREGGWGEPSVVAEKIGLSLTGHARPVEPVVDVRLKESWMTG
jgi:hypothetical protein